MEFRSKRTNIMAPSGCRPALLFQPSHFKDRFYSVRYSPFLHVKVLYILCPLGDGSPRLVGLLNASQPETGIQFALNAC